MAFFSLSHRSQLQKSCDHLVMARGPGPVTPCVPVCVQFILGRSHEVSPVSPTVKSAVLSAFHSLPRLPPPVNKAEDGSFKVPSGPSGCDNLSLVCLGPRSV